MLHFFRKMRRDLLGNSQFFKYLKYAVGEIVLVVLGILIALYINNQNEIRKERQKFDEVLFEVEKELIENIEEARRILHYLYSKDSISNIVYFDSLKPEDYKKESNMDLIFLHRGFRIFIIQSDAYDKLIRLSENIEGEGEDLLYGLKNLYAWIGYDVQVSNQSVISANAEFKEFLSMNEWYFDTRFSKFSDEVFDYYANDSLYKNKISLLIDWTIELAEDIMAFETQARASYGEIHHYLKRTYPHHSEPTQFKFDADNFRHLVGTYNHYWNSPGQEKYNDSTVIFIENNKLFFKAYRRGKINAKKEIIPLTGSRYYVMDHGEFIQTVFDEEGKVAGLNWSGFDFLSKSKKIR